LHCKKVKRPDILTKKNLHSPFLHLHRGKASLTALDQITRSRFINTTRFSFSDGVEERGEERDGFILLCL
jgi:hypothetical protein